MLHLKPCFENKVTLGDLFKTVLALFLYIKYRVQFFLLTAIDLDFKDEGYLLINHGKDTEIDMLVLLWLGLCVSKDTAFPLDHLFSFDRIILQFIIHIEQNFVSLR